MFKWLLSANPSLLIFLLIYTLVIKGAYLLHPAPPLQMPYADGPLYPYLVDFFQHAMGLGNTGFTILANLILFLEALLLNNIINRRRILPAQSFFPAFCYILFSTFFVSWNHFSSPLLANLFLLGLLYQLTGLYATLNPRSQAFNMGLLAGLASLFYLPALGLLLLIWIAQLVARPFRLAEFILVVAGILYPYYFLGTFLFLTDNLEVLLTLPLPLLSYPLLSQSYWILGGMILLLWWFLFGSIRLQQDYMKMLIHIRKDWGIFLAFVFIGLILPFLPNIFSLTGWLIAFLPMSIFVSIGFWHVRKRWFATLIHVSALAFIFFIQWVY